MDAGAILAYFPWIRHDVDENHVLQNTRSTVTDGDQNGCRCPRNSWAAPVDDPVSDTSGKYPSNGVVYTATTVTPEFGGRLKLVLQENYINIESVNASLKNPQSIGFRSFAHKRQRCLNWKEKKDVETPWPAFCNLVCSVYQEVKLNVDLDKRT